MSSATLRPVGSLPVRVIHESRQGQHGNDGSDLYTTYGRYFEVRLVNTREELEEAFRLRYQVYCEENAFEDPTKHPDGLETDCYDKQSAHCLLIYRRSNTVVGTVRLILPPADTSGLTLPIWALCSSPLPVPVATTAEVSRFSISKEVRRRLTDGLYPDENSARKLYDSQHCDRRLLPFITIGLISGLVEMSAAHGVTHWCALMMPALIRLLTRLGIHFKPVGSLVEYHGMRQPCFRDLHDILCQVRRERPDVWDVLTRKGQIWPPNTRSHYEIDPQQAKDSVCS